MKKHYLCEGTYYVFGVIDQKNIFLYEEDECTDRVSYTSSYCNLTDLGKVAFDHALSYDNAFSDAYNKHHDSLSKIESENSNYNNSLWG